MKFTDENGDTFINGVKIKNKQTNALDEISELDESELFVFTDGDEAYAYSIDDYFGGFSNLKALSHSHQKDQPILKAEELKSLLNHFPDLREYVLEESSKNKMLGLISDETLSRIEKMYVDLDYFQSESHKAVALSNFQDYLETLEPEEKYALQTAPFLKAIFKLNNVESFEDFLSKANGGNPYCLAGGSGLMKSAGRVIRHYKSVINAFPELKAEEVKLDLEQVKKELLSHQSSLTFRGSGSAPSAYPSSSFYDDSSIEEDFEDITELLMEHNSLLQADLDKLIAQNDISATNDQNKNILHLSAELNDSTSFLNALDSGVDFTARDNSGKTPLHYATISGNEELMKEIILRGADPCVQDNLGTPAVTPKKLESLANKFPELEIEIKSSKSLRK